MIRLKLGEYMKEHNVTIADVVNITGLRYATVHTYVHDNSASPSLTNLAKIMEALNIRDVSLILEKR